MSNVQRMSQTCMWLRHGRVEMLGPTHEVVPHYEKQTAQEVVSHYEKQTTEPHTAAQPEPIARLTCWSVQSKLSTGVHSIVSGQERVTFRFEIELAAKISGGKIAVSMADAQGLVLFTHEGTIQHTEPGRLVLVLEVRWLPVRPGEYIVSCTISDENHAVAFLRATPELTVLEERDAEHSGYHGLLNLPAKLYVEERDSLALRE
jgi:hypothetical protein